MFKRKKSYDELVPQVMDLNNEANELYQKLSDSESLGDIQKTIYKLAKKGEKLVKLNNDLLSTSEMKDLLDTIQKLSIRRDKLIFGSSFSIMLEKFEKTKSYSSINENNVNFKDIQNKIVFVDQLVIDLSKLFEFPEEVYINDKEEIERIINELEQLSDVLIEYSN